MARTLQLPKAEKRVLAAPPAPTQACLTRVRGHWVCPTQLTWGSSSFSDPELLHQDMGPMHRGAELSVAQVQQAPWVKTAAGPHRKCRRKGKWGSGQNGKRSGQAHGCQAPTCLAEGVMPCCTTMRARVIFSSCIRWQYTLMVLIPTLGSSAGRVHAGPQSHVPRPPLPRHVWHPLLGLQFPSLQKRGLTASRSPSF